MSFPHATEVAIFFSIILPHWAIYLHIGEWCTKHVVQRQGRGNVPMLSGLGLRDERWSKTRRAHVGIFLSWNILAILTVGGNPTKVTHALDF